VSLVVSKLSALTTPGVAPVGVAVRWPAAAVPQRTSDSVQVATTRPALPAVDVELPAEAPAAAGPTSTSLIGGLLDGAKDNIKGLVKTIGDKPLMSGAVVLGYQALILTPFAGLVTGGLAALGIFSLAKKGYTAIQAHNEGDLYGAGHALGSGLTDLGLSRVPKLLGGAKATHEAVSGLQAGKSGLTTAADLVLSNARVARRGVQWVTAASGYVAPPAETKETA
jgi:hypothetical protein